MEFFKATLLAYPFSVCVLVMIVSEIVKQLNEGMRFGMWFRHGGMPSSHSAFVTSLMMVVGTYDGMRSTLFAASTVLVPASCGTTQLLYANNSGSRQKRLISCSNLKNFPNVSGTPFWRWWGEFSWAEF